MTSERAETVFDQKKKTALAVLKTADYDSRLEAMFDSYAIVNVNGKKKFIYIIVRLMTDDLWRKLFWTRTEKLVVYGAEVSSLCDVCERSMDCFVKGRWSDSGFKCRVSRKDLKIERPVTANNAGPAVRVP